MLYWYAGVFVVGGILGFIVGAEVRHLYDWGVI